MFLNQGKTPGGSKITEVNYKICLVVNPTRAGRNQVDHYYYYFYYFYYYYFYRQLPQSRRLKTLY